MAARTPKTYVITGGTKGIGRAVADALLDKGHRVISLARTAPSADYGGEFLAVDLSDRNATLAVAKCLAREYRVDGLVNNVGIVRPGPLVEVDANDLADVLDLTLRPALELTQAFVPGMQDRGWGRVVNVSSLTALGMRQRTSYAAAKAALLGFTRTWALELAVSGITVNAVAPGPTETEMFRVNNPHGSSGERSYLTAVPMGRLAKPAEIAAAICFFLSDDASFITGQTLFVDGGASVGRLSI